MLLTIADQERINNNMSMDEESLGRLIELWEDVNDPTFTEERVAERKRLLIKKLAKIGVTLEEFEWYGFHHYKF